MHQLSKVIVLLGASIVLSACSNRYSVDLAELRQRHATMVGQQSAPAPAKRQEQRKIIASVSDQQPATAGTVGQASDITVGRSNEFKPWPKRGTAEALQLEAEEIAREQRDKAVVNSICRAC